MLYHLYSLVRHIIVYHQSGVIHFVYYEPIGVPNLNGAKKEGGNPFEMAQAFFYLFKQLVLSAVLVK